MQQRRFKRRPGMIDECLDLDALCMVEYGAEFFYGF